MKNLKTKSLFSKLLCIAIALCLAFPLGFFGSVVPKTSFADDEKIDYQEFVKTVNVSGNQFESNASNAPSNPNGWTGAHIGSSSVDVVSGVIELTSSSYSKNYDKFMFDDYPEFKDKYDTPKTPFGISIDNPQSGTKYEGTNKNVLMINAYSGDTAYGYSSDQIILEANSYYHFSTYVKTGSFGQKQGAAFTLTGLDKPVGLWNINTVKELDKDNFDNPILTVDNEYGFVKQSIYLGTGPNSENVNINLSVGDNSEGHYYPSNGYAFFANVNLVKLSPTKYNEEVRYLNNKPNVEIYNFNPDSLKENILSVDISNTKTDIGSFVNGKLGWSKILDKTEYNNSLSFEVLDAGKMSVLDKQGLGITYDPFTPDGKFDSVNKVSKNNNIMVLSSYAGDEKYDTVSAGIKSADIKIKKESYYRISLWYSTTMGASGAAVISGESTSYSSLNVLGPFVNNELTSDKNESRYGWQRTSFYIKGSSYKDVNVNLELWLGKTSPSLGVVMFDNITLEELTFTEYSENSFGGTAISIDSNAVSTSVPNGEFVDVDFKQDDIYPLTPSSWTYINTATAGTIGHSVNPVSTENADGVDSIHGVVLAESNHYNANKKDNYFNIPNPKGESNTKYSNMLVMATPDDTYTAFGYKSSELSISGGLDYKITVKMLTKLIGYGANLVLKNGNSIVCTLENLNTNIYPGAPEFKEYSFYVSGAAGEATLTLEIWLGLTDKGQNDTKLSTGYMFVDSVTMEQIDTDQVEAKLNQYNNHALMQQMDYDFAVYRLGAFDVNAYDRYSSDSVKQMYDMSLSSNLPTNQRRAGVIVPALSDAEGIPEYCFTATSESRFINNNIIFLENSSAGYSKFEADNTLAFTAGQYYKIDFMVLVGGLSIESNPNAVGGGIWLDDVGIQDIRETYKEPALLQNGQPVYELEYKTFSFYYFAGDENQAVKWSISMGAKNEEKNQAMSGTILLSNIVVTTIDSSTFNEVELNQNEEADSRIAVINNSLAKEELPEEELPNQDVDDKNDNGCNDNWPIFPSIIFAIAIIVAIAAVIYKKTKNRKMPKDKSKEKVASYDRKESFSFGENVVADQSFNVIDFEDDAYEEFDETNASSNIKAQQNVNTLDESKRINKNDDKKEKSEQPQDTALNEFDD